MAVHLHVGHGMKGLLQTGAETSCHKGRTQQRATSGSFTNPMAVSRGELFSDPFVCSYGLSDGLLHDGVLRERIDR